MNKACTGNIIWLASYPKSGNTWTRIFLHTLKTGSPLESLSEIESTNGISSSRNQIDRYLGADSMDLSFGDIRKLKQQIFIKWSNKIQEPAIVKTHEKPFAFGQKIIPHEATKKVILIVRNPFDMIASYANHMGTSLNKSVRAICSDVNMLAASRKKGLDQVEQHIGSWSSYINEWQNTFGQNVFLIKYEELKKAPFNTFKNLVKFLNWKHSDDEIQTAIKNSDFQKIKVLENDAGFGEKSSKSQLFFRTGKSGGWRTELTKEMTETLIDKNYNKLLELKYIDKERNIII